MQSKDNFNTYLPEESCWAVLRDHSEIVSVSPGMKSLAESIGMQTATLVSLLEKTEPGFWPIRIGGNLCTTSSMSLDSTSRIVHLELSDSVKIAELLKKTTGEELFILCSSDGRILTRSEQTENIFNESDLLASMFDSSSSGAIQAAIRKCLLEGSVPEFLVSHTSEDGQRANYGLTMRRLPTPGKLVFCRLQVPSVAVVTGTLDRNSMIRILLEESFCPNITMDPDGVITSMNPVAKAIAQEIWGRDTTGSLFFDLVHPEQREAVKNRHEQRMKGYAVPSRYTIQLSGKAKSGISATDVSVVSLHGLDRWVVFMRPIESETGQCAGNLPAGLQNLLEKNRITPEEAILELAVFLKATTAAYVTDNGIMTTGDSENLIKSLNRNELAAASTGFIKDNTYHHRISSGFGASHLLLQIPDNKQLNPMENRAIEITSRILEGYHAQSILDHERKLLSLTREIASAYLGRNESIDGLLSDFTRISSMETAAVFKISKTGNFLRGIAGAGTVGSLPDLPLEALNTASWACLRGETAFYTGSPENDLRFSRVFPESLSEIAVPFFRGTTPDGVILLASSERDHFTASSGDFIHLLALLFSSLEGSSGETDTSEGEDDNSVLKDMAINNLIHGMSGLQSAFAARAELLRKAIDGQTDAGNFLKSLLETAALLDFHGKWALWFLRTSLFDGKPQQKWIDPAPLLEKTLTEFRRLSTSEGLDIVFNPPSSDLEVCTDGSFVSMIAHSLIGCILENTPECSGIEMSLDSKEDHWTFSIDSRGDSIPGECLSTRRQPDNRNMAFVLAWKLTEELGGTVSTFSNRGRSTRIVVRLRISG